jgi:hypothetical protein
MTNTTIYVNLTNFKSIRGNVFIGKEQGEYAREVLKIDSIDAKLLDDKKLELEIQFPKDTASVTQSFFKGLLGPTFKHIGYDAFYARVKFYAESYENGIIHDVNEFLRQMRNIYDQ